MEEKSIEQLMKEHYAQPWELYEQRQYLPEPDYKLEAVKAASTIPSENLEQFMSRVDFIHKYLTEKKNPKHKMATDKYTETYH